MFFIRSANLLVHLQSANYNLRVVVIWRFRKWRAALPLQFWNDQRTGLLTSRPISSGGPLLLQPLNLSSLSLSILLGSGGGWRRPAWELRSGTAVAGNPSSPISRSFHAGNARCRVLSASLCLRFTSSLQVLTRCIVFFFSCMFRYASRPHLRENLGFLSKEMRQLADFEFSIEEDAASGHIEIGPRLVQIDLVVNLVLMFHHIFTLAGY